ncbi:MAG: hypothetical protein HUU50_11090 [Candidatus Brocadiae bacterium]|nr:hypothetical protein [Candidatus Brocadiia bacterium]
MHFRYVFLLALLFISYSAADEEKNFRDAVDRVWKNAQYQKRVDPPAEEENLYRKKRTEPCFRFPDFKNFFSFSGEGFWKIFVYVAAFFMAGAILFYLLRYWKRLEKNLPDPNSVGKKAADQNLLKTELEEDPEELYQKGLYLEACRALLRNIIQDLVKQKHIPDKRYLTNIELLHCVKQESLHIAFQRLSKTVERGYYAEETLNQEDYQTCRTIWKQMKESLSVLPK